MDKWELALATALEFINGAFAEHLKLYASVQESALTKQEIKRMTQMEQRVNAQSEIAAGLAEETSREQSDQLAEQLTATVERLRDTVKDANRIMREILERKAKK
jgi:hypothetical protein